MKYFSLHRGFSLVEILLSISITLILFSLSLPSLSQIIRDTQDKLGRYEMVDAFQFAHEFALTSHSSVSICGVTNKQCSAIWSKHIIIFLDPTHRGDLRSGKIIKEVILSSPKALIWKSSFHKNYLNWLANGSTDSQISSLRMKNKNEDIWTITINRYGRVK